MEQTRQETAWVTVLAVLKTWLYMIPRKLEENKCQRNYG